ncbi:MAG TPA: DUF4276 family protein [Tepidisphaeraceae bacterium]|nr:DUF4276 family protein [Tepidisphaeraceae bacterium]
MKKLAVFVEGQTEHLFIEKLIREVAGAHRVRIEGIRCQGGRNVPRLYTAITATAPSGGEYYVLIFECSGDGHVLSVLRDRYASLMSEGYSLLLGLRDVYPIPDSEFANLEATTAKLIPSGGLPAYLVFAKREIEAWFLAESAHLITIDARLNPREAERIAGTSIAPENVEKIDHPAQLLDTIYRAVGFRYRKDKRRLQRVVEAIDYANLYLHVASLVPNLGKFCAHIDTFLN